MKYSLLLLLSMINCIATKVYYYNVACSDGSCMSATFEIKKVADEYCKGNDKCKVTELYFLK